MKTGDLWNQPRGLGHLVVGGYLPDVRSLWCPSAQNSNHTPGWHWKSQNSIGSGLDSLAGFLKAGGLDGYTLTHGNWAHAAPGTGGYYGNQTIVSVPYDYRNQPVHSGSTVFRADADLFPVRDTSPVVKTTHNCPPFKTTKTVAGRALVNDSCARGAQQADPGAPIGSRYPGAGFAYKSHREGYNVLYSDSSARWFDDPEGRIAWLDPAAYGWTGNWDFWTRSPIGATNLDVAYNGIGNAVYNTPKFIPYHMFDQAGGMDLDAAY